MTGADDEREFENFLQRRSPLLRRLSDLDHAEPAAQLDRIVVENARRSIGPLREGLSASPRRWALPAGLAATVVIATSLALYLGAPGTPVSIAVPTAAPAVAPPALQEAPPSSAPRMPSAPMPSAPMPPPPTPAVPMPAAAPAATAGAVAEADALQRAETAEPVLERKANVSARSRAPSTAADSAARRDPAEWLAQIRRLRATGHAADADREWNAFRAAWPDYAVPEDASGALTR